MMLRNHGSRFNGDEPQGDFCDDAGKAHPTNGGPEQFHLLLGRTALPLAVCQNQFDFLHMITESSNAMMVLPVHIRGDAAAERDELRPGRHRWKPAARNKRLEHFGERASSFSP